MLQAVLTGAKVFAYVAAGIANLAIAGVVCSVLIDTDEKKETEKKKKNEGAEATAAAA